MGVQSGHGSQRRQTQPAFTLPSMIGGPGGENPLAALAGGLSRAHWSGAMGGKAGPLDLTEAAVVLAGPGAEGSLAVGVCSDAEACSAFGLGKAAATPPSGAFPEAGAGAVDALVSTRALFWSAPRTIVGVVRWVDARPMYSSIKFRIRASRAPPEVPPSTTATMCR